MLTLPNITVEKTEQHVLHVSAGFSTCSSCICWVLPMFPCLLGSPHVLPKCVWFSLFSPLVFSCSICLLWVIFMFSMSLLGSLHVLMCLSVQVFPEVQDEVVTGKKKFSKNVKMSLPSSAVRTATLGSWRMLTLGAEYEDTWLVPTSTRSSSSRRRLQVEEKVEAEETGPKQEVETEPTSWTQGDARKYDAVLLLNGWQSNSGGVHHMIRRHEEQNRR